MSLRRYPEGIDSVWLASDMHGNVAAFVTGGSGPVPISALRESSPLLEDIEQTVCQLEEESDARMLVEVNRPDDFLDLATRGLFVYDWSDLHRTKRDRLRAYELVAVPTQTLIMGKQPEFIRRLVADNGFVGVAFATSNPLDVSLHLPCCEPRGE